GNKCNGESKNSSSNASTSTNTSNVNTSSQSSSQAAANPFINDNKTVDTSWVKQEVTCTTGGAINLRTGASTNSSVIAQLPANTEVKYDAYSTKGNYTWLRQPSANNQYDYIVGRANGQD
ncbi:SH3 domain-containing protein, partial [Lactobacillus taiwanensis]|uniref:SH3 domain-containing protein n=1 Tax=Lactobacillus taiwanensis TaxID=508451 RepID=UPI0028FC7D66